MKLNLKQKEILTDSLDETLVTVEQLLIYRKESGGCLGYPSTQLLLSAINSMGAYYYNNNMFIVINYKEI